jgi:hypothetical protein
VAEPYSISADDLGEFCAELVSEVRKRDPQLNDIKFEYSDGTVASLKLKGKKPKRSPLQSGPTVTEGRPAGYYDAKELQTRIDRACAKLDEYGTRFAKDGFLHAGLALEGVRKLLKGEP